jgi:hypothetical protein
MGTYFPEACFVHDVLTFSIAAWRRRHVWSVSVPRFDNITVNFKIILSVFSMAALDILCVWICGLEHSLVEFDDVINN